MFATYEWFNTLQKKLLVLLFCFLFCVIPITVKYFWYFRTVFLLTAEKMMVVVGSY